MRITSYLVSMSCALTLVAVAMFFVYFEAANASFSAGSIAVEALPAEIARWGTTGSSRPALGGRLCAQRAADPRPAHRQTGICGPAAP